MKKIAFTSLFALLATVVFAQTDPVAKALLQKVSNKYEAYKTISSDFSLVVKNSDGKTFSNSGSMYFNKPSNQYRIKMQDEDIISDGKSVYNISNELKEVQITEVDNNSSTIGPNNLFTFYKTGYKYVGMPDEKITKDNKTEALKVVELSPLDTKTNYFKIKLRVNKNNHIHDITIFDKSSNRYIYAIQALYVNQNLSKNNFVFQKDKYKDFEIVDLR